MNTNKYNKIIYLFERRHHYVYDHSMFGMDLLEKQNISYEVWVAVNWTFGDNAKEPKNVEKTDCLFYIDDESDLIDNLDRVSSEKCLFIVHPYHSYSHISYIIRKHITKYSFEFYNLTENLDIVEYPINHSFYIYGFFRDIKSLVYATIEFIHNLHCNKGKKYLIPDRWYKLFGPIRYKSLKNLCITHFSKYYMPSLFEMCTPRNEVFSQSFNENKNEQGDVECKYAVFVDEFECGHSDWIKLGMELPIRDKELYYDEMNKFFDRVEKGLGLKVIVAAHPKAEYCGDEYNGREIVYFKTNSLIRNSSLVLYIYGTSIVDVIKYKKPLLHFYTSQHMRGHEVDGYINKIDKLLGSRSMNIAEDNNIEKFIFADLNTYENFRHIMMDCNNVLYESDVRRYILKCAMSELCVEGDIKD